MGDEWWRWVWLAPDGSEAGHLGIVLGRARTHVTAALSRPSEALVVLDEPDAPLPRPGALEIRASGLWVDAIEEESGRRWTVGVEAFALAVEHPEDAVGHRVPLGFDLEWEGVDPSGDAAGGTPARVLGEVLVGDDSVEVDAGGWWSHWGAGEAHR